MYNTQRFAIVVTHTGRRSRLLDMPWLVTDYQIDESDWVVLSGEGWRAVAEGDATIWDALERKLFVGFYVSHPQLIAVIGHPSGREATCHRATDGARVTNPCSQRQHSGHGSSRSCSRLRVRPSLPIAPPRKRSERRTPNSMNNAGRHGCRPALFLNIEEAMGCD